MFVEHFQEVCQHGCVHMFHIVTLCQIKYELQMHLLNNIGNPCNNQLRGLIQRSVAPAFLMGVFMEKSKINSVDSGMTEDSISSS